MIDVEHDDALGRTVDEPAASPAVCTPAEHHAVPVPGRADRRTVEAGKDPGEDDRIVVRPNEAETQTASGLVIPDTAKEKPQVGEVVAVGPGARDDDGERIAMDVSVGDKVLYSKFAGTEVKLDSDEYLVLSERDLLAIVK